MTEQTKRFEDWRDVDCNECSHYWQDQCDGASKGSSIACNSFSATRKVVIPERLKALEKQVESMRVGNIIIAGVVLFQIVMHLLEWF